MERENGLMHIDDAYGKVFDCQRRVAVIHEAVRSITQRRMNSDVNSEMESCCLIEAERELDGVFETLRDIVNRSPWCQADETAKGDAA